MTEEVKKEQTAQIIENKSDEEDEKTIKLTTMDGESIEVSHKIATKSILVKGLL